MIRLLVVSGGRVLAGKKITPGSEVEQNLTSLLKTRPAGDPDRIGKQCYPDATSMLLLLDCGGRNASNRYIFKHYLQQLADRIGMEIRVAHYPSYCSKYNRIERRLFPHITRACTGLLFDSLDTVLNLMRSATTSTVLKTTVNVIHDRGHGNRW